MPPRYSYWTIIAGGLPTAFRAVDRDELMPTFRRLRAKHPDATMKWFARGKLWESPDAARHELEMRRAPSRPRAADGRPAPTGPRRDGRPPTGPAARAASTARPSRPRDWRPGGEHKDPRQPFKDAKRERNQLHRAKRFERKTRNDSRPPAGDAPPARPVRPPRRPAGRRGPGSRRS